MVQEKIFQTLEIVEGCRGDGFYIVLTQRQSCEGSQSVKIGVHNVRNGVLAQVQAQEIGQAVQSSLPCSQNTLLLVSQVEQQQPTDDRDPGVGDLEFRQPPEPPDGGRESEGVVGGGGGGDDEAAGVERNTVQGEVILVMSSTLDLTINHLKSSEKERLVLP